VGPVILGSIGEVEQRTMALEARAFGRPGRRTLLWSPPDSTAQRAGRWLLVGGVLVLAVARIARILP
jgi:energy-coupling factor transport system permease protein